MADNGKVAKGPRLVAESMDLYGTLPGFPQINGGGLFAEVGPYGFMDGGYGTQYLSRRDNRMAGEVLPLFINWAQLKMVRDRSRFICRNNEFAIAAINTHKSYVVGTGFTYTVQARSENTDPTLIQKVQDLVDLCCEHNRMPEIESEAIQRYHADGEWFWRVFRGSDGLLRVRFVEPELVRSPADDDTPANSFGIICKNEDIHDRTAYWVIERPWESSTPTKVPAEQIIHVRANVESNSKRGLPTVYAVEANLKSAEDVLASMIAVAKARSKIAVIRKVNDSPPEAVEELNRKATDYTVSDPTSGARTNISHMGYGSILTSSGNIEYEFPAMNIGSADLVETLSANLRAIAARFGITETMMSTDASNNNYASALVAEAPAVKTFERMQKLIGQTVAERRTRPERSILWMQIQHAVDLGLLPADTLERITIRAKGPGLVSRDYDREANTAKTYLDMGLWSPQTVTADSGKNFEEEQRNIGKYKEELAQKAPTPSTDGSQEKGEPTEQVQDTALNGAQISSLVDLAVQAATGALPVSSAKAIATAAFPSVNGQLLEKIFAEIKADAKMATAPAQQPQPAAG